MRVPRKPIGWLPFWIVGCVAVAQEGESRPRLRDLGVAVGELPTGEHNAITDVPGVRVGHSTVWRGDSIRTGVTAILPHGGDIYRKKVPGAFDSYNSFGKPFGVAQVGELGEIETPILLGPTLSVPRIADAVMTHVIQGDRSGRILSINPVVGETNDGYLSDIRARPIREEHVLRAIREAHGGPVEEGSVGAGTGTRCLGYKGGVGTSSRRVKTGGAEWVVGVLAQTNFGGELRILGRPVATGTPRRAERTEGSCAMVLATNAPLDARQLRRLARRTFAGMARTGASFSHGSGDYTFAFSTGFLDTTPRAPLPDAVLTPLFRAAADAAEEAILNSLLRARSVKGWKGHEVKALPVESVRAALRGAGAKEGKRPGGP